MDHFYSVKNSKIPLLLLGLCASFVLVGLGGLLPDTQRVAVYYARTGFAGIMLSFALWACSLVRAYTGSGFLRRDWLAFVLATVLVVCAFLCSTPRFRVLYDEANLAAVAMGMYETYQPLAPMNGYFDASGFHGVEYEADKRPLAFPFLVYITHAFRGYDGYNGFVVNFCASVLVLLCLFTLVRRRAPPTEAYVGMLLLAAYPLYVLWATCGGFEMVNLAFVLLVFVFFDDFLRVRTAVNAEKVLMTLLVLTQCRSESVVFLAVMLPACACLLPRAEYKKLSFFSAIFPLLLLPWAWQLKLFSVSSAYQVTVGAPVFSASYVIENCARALSFLRGGQSAYAMVPVVFYVALCGVARVLYLWAKKRLCANERVLGCVAVLSYALLSVVLFSYHAGDVTAAVGIRLGLVYVPLLVVLCLIALRSLTSARPVLARYTCVLAVALLAWYWPVAGKAEPMADFTAGHAYARVLDYLEKEYPNKKAFVVADRAHPYLTHRYGGATFAFAREHMDTLLFVLGSGLYRDVLVVQELDGTGRPRGGPRGGMSGELPLKSLHQEFLDANTILRIAKVDTELMEQVE